MVRPLATFTIRPTSEADTWIDLGSRCCFSRGFTEPRRGGSRFRSADVVWNERRGADRARLARCTLQRSSQGTMGPSCAESLDVNSVYASVLCCNCYVPGFRDKDCLAAKSGIIYVPRSRAPSSVELDTIHHSSEHASLNAFECYSCHEVFLFHVSGQNTSDATTRSSTDSGRPSSTRTHSILDWNHTLWVQGCTRATKRVTRYVLEMRPAAITQPRPLTDPVR